MACPLCLNPKTKGAAMRYRRRRLRRRGRRRGVFGRRAGIRF